MRQSAESSFQDQLKDATIGGSQSMSLVHGSLEVPVNSSEHGYASLSSHNVGHGTGLLELEAQVALDLHVATPHVRFHSQIEAAKKPVLGDVPTRWQGLQRTLALATLVGCGVAFAVAGLNWLHHLQGRLLSLVVCGVYVAFSVIIDVSIAVQKGSTAQSAVGAYSFDPTCAVMLTEATKLVVSMVLYLRSVLQANAEKEAPSSIIESLKDSGISFTDANWLFLPAALFTANNLLVYKAIGGNDMAAFGVFRDTVIIFTAAIWCIIFKTPLGNIRLAGIAVIFVGLALNRVGLVAGGNAWSWAILWVLLMSMTNSLASVSNEFALKRSQGVDINLQNTVLYASGLGCGALVLLVTDVQRLSSPTTFFAGFTRSTLFTVFVQVVAGLLVSRILKYADAVTKTVASCLRGPLVVLIAPIFVTSPQDLFTNVSALVVATGCFAYLSAGKLEIANPNSAQAQAHTTQAKLDANQMDAG